MDLGGDLSALPSGLDGVSRLQELVTTGNEGAIQNSDAVVVTGLDPFLRCGSVFFQQYKLVVNGTCGYDAAFNQSFMAGWSVPNDANYPQPELPPANESDIVLFDLHQDPRERLDLGASFPEVCGTVCAFQTRLIQVGSSTVSSRLLFCCLVMG